MKNVEALEFLGIVILRIEHYEKITVELMKEGKSSSFRYKGFMRRITELRRMALKIWSVKENVTLTYKKSPCYCIGQVKKAWKSANKSAGHLVGKGARMTVLIADKSFTRKEWETFLQS